MNREALRLYLVTNRYQDSVESFLEKVETACRSGVTIVQLREKNLTTNQYYQLAKEVKEITDTYQVPLIIDDRLDVCLAVDAAGLHIGDDELPVLVARQVLGFISFCFDFWRLSHLSPQRQLLSILEACLAF